MVSLCLICNNEIMSVSPRYPRMVCAQCHVSIKKDESGYLVEFQNIDLFGGFQSIHDINGLKVTKNEHICYINNVRCYADEARFGGIVIQAALEHGQY
jgi:hypothetical protein